MGGGGDKLIENAPNLKPISCCHPGCNCDDDARENGPGVNFGYYTKPADEQSGRQCSCGDYSLAIEYCKYS
jgi:hypothetical protein